MKNAELVEKDLKKLFKTYFEKQKEHRDKIISSPLRDQIEVIKTKRGEK